MEYVNRKLEEFYNYIENKNVAIIGLGVSNKPLIQYLNDRKVNITVFDNRGRASIDEETLKQLSKYNIKAYFGENCLDDLKGFDIIFRSPSCRPDKKEILQEVQNGAIVTTEIEMLLQLCPGKTIGITGSDGKTTTTTLIYNILKEKGYNCYLGGNIGVPLFTKIDEMTPDDIVVLELSSFQLMDMEISPNISVVTNVTPNHLDIHKDYNEYINAKKAIFNFQNKNGLVVLNYDNEITREFAKDAKGNYLFFSSKEKLDNGYIYNDGIIKLCEKGLRRHIINVKDIHLRGVHNYENICAALAATSTLVDIDTQIKAICKFKGVEHRLELVREINGVKWYNDSIGTSPTRTIAGLKSFDENIVLIAGGYDKKLDYTPIAKPILEKVTTLILMGATAGKIYDAVVNEMKKQNKTIDIYKCDTLEETVITANKTAKSGEVVLFSPASASFDLFKNFAERGNKFKELVEKL